ncbi:MAG TPA: histidine phosphatase family protein [Solirubrobacterales bacterium]|nr:histidine phosphatase family protein [Solirubrobacterales bacterium]
MRRLYLLRHAKSSWDDPALADSERPLAPRGRRASKLIARHFRSERIRPELVLCSPARRARETLERIAGALGDDAEIRIDSELYGASSSDLLARIRALPEGIGSAMLIGHNPGIQDLAVSLAGEGPGTERMRPKFPTAALATLELDGRWRDLGSGRASLVAFVKPRELES